MTVERLLIWTYQDQAADAIMGRGGAYAGWRGGDSAAAVGSRAALGVSVRGGGYRALRLHVDAEAMHDAVKALPSRMIGLVIKYAKAGARPDWMPGAVPRLYPKRRGDGRVVVERDGNRHPSWCPVRIDPLPEHIAFQRALYALWWDALALLVAAEPALEDHQMLPLDVAREPWLVKPLDFAKKP